MPAEVVVEHTTEQAGQVVPAVVALGPEMSLHQLEEEQILVVVQALPDIVVVPVALRQQVPPASWSSVI